MTRSVPDSLHAALRTDLVIHSYQMPITFDSHQPVIIYVKKSYGISEVVNDTFFHNHFTDFFGLVKALS